MEAVLSLDSGVQQPADLDGDTGVVLGPDGQVKFDDNDGNWARPEATDVKTIDGIGGTASLKSLLGTVLNTQTLASAAPTISNVIFQSFTASSVDFTPTETTTLVNLTPTTAQQSSFAVSLSTSLASSITSLDAAQSSSAPVPESTTDFSSSLLLSSSWATSGTSFSSYPSVASSSHDPLSSSILESSATSSSSVSLSTSMVSQTSTNHSFKTSISTTSTTPRPTSVRSSSTTAQLPTQAVVPTSSPTALNVHNPTFYAGLTLGSIISVGLLAALVAWCIRSRSRRRRNARLMVPWGPPGDMNDAGLEEGISAFDTGRTAQAAMNLGSREDLASVQAWSPRGDRDVGEPKRAEGYFNGPYYGLSDHHNSRNDQYPFLSNGPPPQAAATPDSFSKRCLPAHLIAEDIVSRASPAGFAHDGRYSRIAYPQSAYAGSTYRTYDAARASPLDDPQRDAGKSWNGTAQHPSEPRSISMAARLRNSRMPAAELPGAELTSALPEGPRAANAEMEEWGQSIKASLVNAFNAVAANLGAGAPHLAEDDKLTVPPSRRSTRKSLKGISGGTGNASESRAHRKGSVSSTVSKPWSLEETGDGAGIVHIHLPGLGESKSPTSQQFVQQQDRGQNNTGSYATKSDSIWPSTAPLPAVVETSKPQRAFVRPNDYYEKNNKTAGFTPSRSSSIYSTMSAARSTTLARGASRLPRMRSVTDWKAGHLKEEDTVVIRPDTETISRLPSADSSVTLGRNSMDDKASRALQMRLKRYDSAIGSRT